MTDLRYLLPWEFSPTIFFTTVIAVVLYIRGLLVLRRGGQRIGFWRPFTYLLGVVLCYAMLQTYVDYLSQHMFWIHRFQHLILHHVGPVLIVLATPEAILCAGIPRRLTRLKAPATWIFSPLRLLLRLIQHPLIAPLLFVGLIYFWLIPSIHFTAMLDVRRYRMMNWSMLADGILFWWLMLAPREIQGPRAISYGLRILILALVALPQILIGSYITLHNTLLYDVYAICGRAWDISPIDDQQLGGLLTWIPAAMMSLVGILVLLHRLMHGSAASHSSALAALAHQTPAAPSA